MTLWCGITEMTGSDPGHLSTFFCAISNSGRWPNAVFWPFRSLLHHSEEARSGSSRPCRSRRNLFLLDQIYTGANLRRRSSICLSASSPKRQVLRRNYMSMPYLQHSSWPSRTVIFPNGRLYALSIQWPHIGQLILWPVNSLRPSTIFSFIVLPPILLRSRSRNRIFCISGIAGLSTAFLPV